MVKEIDFTRQKAPVEKTMDLLLANYGELVAYSGTEKTPFRVLIGTVLSSRTRDEKTSLAAGQLFEYYDTPSKLAKATEGHVRELIKPVGFYNVKAKRVIELSKELLERFGGVVPDNMAELVSLKGVGRKTANCVLNYAFEKPGIAVDSHVAIISKRLGWTKQDKPESVEKDLEALLPKKYWIKVNNALVLHGQQVCISQSPQCQKCFLTKECPYYENVYKVKKNVR